MTAIIGIYNPSSAPFAWVACFRGGSRLSRLSLVGRLQKRACLRHKRRRHAKPLGCSLPARLAAKTLFHFANRFVERKALEQPEVGPVFLARLTAGCIIVRHD